MYNIAICDDDLGFIEFIKEIIAELGFANEVNIFEYLSGEEFVADMNERNDLDLLILDICLKKMDGNQVAEEFRKRYKSTALVFCSGMYKPSPENIKVSPYRYLLKEYSKKKMLEEFAEIFEYLNEKKNEPVILCIDGKNYIHVQPREILYISIAKRGTNIHMYHRGTNTLETKVYLCREKLSELYSRLKDCNFVYAHNSYIVNMEYVKKRSREEIQMINGEMLSVSRARSKELKEKLTIYFERKYR